MSQTPELAAPSPSSAGSPALKDRPFRVKLRGSVLTLIRLPNRRELRGKLHQLSITGGLMHVEKPLDEKLKVELIFQLGPNTVREQAEMLFPMWATQGWLQPFHFIELAEANKNDLEKTLLSFVQHPPEPSQDQVTSAKPIDGAVPEAPPLQEQGPPAAAAHSD
jgi:hypothetical protein